MIELVAMFAVRVDMYIRVLILGMTIFSVFIVMTFYLLSYFLQFCRF